MGGRLNVRKQFRKGGFVNGPKALLWGVPKGCPTYLEK